MSDARESQAQQPVLPPAKAEGAFLALAAGDALGWPQEMPRNVVGGSGNKNAHVEFVEWRRRSGGRFRPYEEVIRPGDYSDDTQLTLAVARCRTNHGPDWWKALTRVELPLWTVYERGGGGATKRAAKAWGDGHPPWKSNKADRVRQYFSAGGNGVAMRVLPHALFLAGDATSAALAHDVVLDGSATHGHPRALVGARAYAHAAWSLARRTNTLRFGELVDALIDEACQWSGFPESKQNGSSWFQAADDATNGEYQRIWDETCREMRDLLETARKGLEAGALADDHAVMKELGCFGRNKGAGTSSAAVAAYLVARHAAQPTQGILRAAFEKGADTDTLAAMAGGLMGCLAGVEWLPPSWFHVQDAEYLRSIASRVASGPDGADHQPVGTPTRPQSIFSDLGRKGEVDRELAFGGARRVRAVCLPNPRTSAKSIAIRAWRLSASDGQTMYVAKVDRLARAAPVDRPVGKLNADQRASSVGESADPADESPLYVEFRRQLEHLLSTAGEMKPKEIEAALDLVRSQVSTWLARAEREGWLQKISKRPVKVALSGNQGSLL